MRTKPARKPWPPNSTIEGYHWEAHASDEWVTPAVGAGRCRFTIVSERGRQCAKPAVATLFRTHHFRSGSKKIPWDYCTEHLYGRWVEDGKVMGWRRVRDEA